MTGTAPAPRRRLLGRRTVVLAGTAFSALLAGTSRTTWVQASGPDLTGTVQQVAVSGADAAPEVLALALVAIAASLATSLSSVWLRFLTGPVLILTGIGAALAALAVHRDPVSSATSALTSSAGVAGATVAADATSGPLLTLAPARVVAAIGVIVLVVGGSWPVGTRYRSAAVTAAADPADDPAAAWDALTRGEDPSLVDEDPERAGGDTAEPR